MYYSESSVFLCGKNLQQSKHEQPGEHLQLKYKLNGASPNPNVENIKCYRGATGGNGGKHLQTISSIPLCINGGDRIVVDIVSGCGGVDRRRRGKRGDGGADIMLEKKILSHRVDNTLAPLIVTQKHKGVISTLLGTRHKTRRYKQRTQYHCHYTYVYPYRLRMLKFIRLFVTFYRYYC